MALDLKAPAGPLEKLGACLQPFKKAPDEKWDEALWYDEGLDAITTPPDTWIEAGKLTTCSQRLLDFVEAYGAALGSGDDGSKVEVGADLFLQSGLTRAKIDSFLEELGKTIDDEAELSDFPLRLILRLNKRKLLEAQLENLPFDVRPALVFRPGAFGKLLSGDFESLESWWDEKDPRRLVVFVPAWPHFLAGPLLAVVGGDPRAGLARLGLGGDDRPAAPPAPGAGSPP